MEKMFWDDKQIIQDARQCKFFFDEPPEIGDCQYLFGDSTSLLVKYTVKVLPYLGIWINKGGFKKIYSITIEPCSGIMDRIDIAKKLKKNSILQSYGTIKWIMEFILPN